MIGIFTKAAIRRMLFTSIHHRCVLMFMKITETGEKLSEILWAMVGTTGTF